MSAGLLSIAFTIGGGHSSLAASIAVTTTADEANADGDCSLREALEAANTNTAVDMCPAGNGTAGDTIELEDGAMYLLSLPGDGDATGDLDVGAGGPVLITQSTGGTATIDGAGLDRVLQVAGGASAAMANVTIQNGAAPAGESGGGIANAGTLTLTNVVVTGSSASSGGGLYNSGSLTAAAVRFTNNTAGSGGAIAAEAGSATTLTDVTIDDNDATEGGGGIANGGTLTLERVALSNNSASQRGGGLVNDGPAAGLTATNTTITGNQAAEGGGIYNGSNGAVSLNNVTLAGNVSTSAGDEIKNAGGTAELRNSIVAGPNPAQNCAGAVSSSGSNLDSANSCGFSAPGDQHDTDPMLGPPADYGGRTNTRALREGSPARDAGDPGSCAALDQREVVRPVDGTGDGAASCDIGAYEAGGDYDGDSQGLLQAGLPVNSDEREALFLGTNPIQGCAETATPDDEAGPDPWPPDFNDSQAVNTTDVLAMKPVFNQPAAYSARYDFNANGAVTTTDLLFLKPFFGTTCID